MDAPTSYPLNSTTYGYDAVGNQVTRTYTPTNKVQNRTFDPENRVVQIVSNTYTTKFIYGPNGERVIKSVTNTPPQGGEGGELPSSGATERTLYVGGYEEQLPINQTIAWTSPSNASASSPVYSLKKTGTNSAWDAGAISTQSITSAQGDGYVSVVADATNTHRAFGLGNSNQGVDLEDIDFAIYLKGDGTLEIWESGEEMGDFGTYQVGDVLRVGVESGAVKYYRNSTLLYTAEKEPSYPLYLDTSLYTPGSVLVGALLCAGSACTSSMSTPEYTTYYSFGGKMVGMRRANASVGNGQYRIVGDHLGSTTLIVNTDTPPTVVQRQYHKPYGETAWQYTSTSTGGESLTNVGYTGQRTDEDSTGLMFYNARMYDPVIGSFISSDTIAPDQSDPKRRNRFGYVSSNPLRNIDPSGHSELSLTSILEFDFELQIQNRPDTPMPPSECDTTRCALDAIGTYGINVLQSDQWTLDELNAILYALEALMNAAQWTIDDFKSAMGPIDLSNRACLVVGCTQDHGDHREIAFDLSQLREKVRILPRRFCVNTWFMNSHTFGI